MLSYKDLTVWQKAVSFAVHIYELTKQFPESEKFALQSQLRRAGISIPSNIAEGSKRGTRKDYASFLKIALGSGAELETQLIIAKELGYISEKEYKKSEEILSEIMRMLTAMIKTLSTKN